MEKYSCIAVRLCLDCEINSLNSEELEMQGDQKVALHPYK